jgi:hypothetical protein
LLLSVGPKKRNERRKELRKAKLAVTWDLQEKKNEVLYT